jgi:hypothetical protein
VSAADRHAGAESFPQRARHLADVGDLLHRRGDETRETFPDRLAHDAQATAVITGARHGWIIGKGRADIRQRMIQREIPLHLVRGPARHVQFAAVLLHINRQLANRADKAGVVRFPVKRLTGVERQRQIELW